MLCAIYPIITTNNKVNALVALVNAQFVFQPIPAPNAQTNSCSTTFSKENKWKDFAKQKRLCQKDSHNSIAIGTLSNKGPFAFLARLTAPRDATLDI